MRMGVAGILELIATLTVGMGLARYEYLAHLDQTMPTPMRVGQVKSSFLAGVVVTAGLGLVVESIRRRGQGVTWGVGRWILAISAVSFWMGGARELIEGRIRSYGYREDFDWIGQVSGIVYKSAIWSSVTFFDEVVIVFALTYWLAGSRSGVVADAREWGGRAFGMLLVALWAYGRVSFVHDMLS